MHNEIVRSRPELFGPSARARSRGARPLLLSARDVGERLRAVRRERRLSLQDVEARSGQEFKASIVGAYERGERELSVGRLIGLAELYDVPVGRLVTPEWKPDDEIDLTGDAPGPRRDRETAKPIIVDLVAVARSEDPMAASVARFSAAVEQLREDDRHRFLRLRGSDLPVLCAALGVTMDELVMRLRRTRVIEDPNEPRPHGSVPETRGPLQHVD